MDAIHCRSLPRPQHQPQHQPRVLVVNNDTATREDHARNLRRWDYDPVLAQGHGAALLLDAQRQARANRCQIALIDVRLLDNRDSSHTSDPELIARLQPAISVVASAWGDQSRLVEAVREKKAFEVASAEEGPPRLRAVIDAVAARSCACRHPATICWATDLSAERVAATLFPHDSCVPADEIDDLLGRLFPEAAQIMLEPLAATTRAVTQEEPNIVLKAQCRSATGVVQQSVVVRFAPVDLIRRELTTYRTYVAEQIGSGRTPFLLCSHESWDLGATMYTLLKANMSFRTWYKIADTNAISGLISELFHDLLGDWYTHSKPHHVHLLDHYRAEIDLPLSTRITSKNPAPLTPLALPHSLPNPLTWLETHAEQSYMALPWSVTHCNLHADTIMTDSCDRPWITNLECVAPGPALRDFARLETDIRLRLLSVEQVDLAQLDWFNIVLFAPLAPNDQPNWHAPAYMAATTSDALAKAYTVICTLRQVACELTGFQSMEAYYWILLLETVAVARQSRPEDPIVERAFLTAALLCERLDRWATEMAAT